MQIEIKTRNFTLDDDRKEKITSDLNKLERFCPRPPVAARLNIVMRSRASRDINATGEPSNTLARYSLVTVYVLFC